jgi:hypothetical protein
VKVKRSIMISIGSYSEILREKKELLIVNTACFLQIRGRSSTRDFVRDIKSLHCATVAKDQCRGHTFVLKKLLVWAWNISRFM